MSFILDALRRAERERNAASAPELRIVTDGSGARIATRRPPWPWIGASFAAAFVLALLLVALLRPSSKPGAEADATPVAAQPVAETPATEVSAAPAEADDNALESAMAERSRPDTSNPKHLDDLVDPDAGMSETPPQPQLLSPEESQMALQPDLPTAAQSPSPAADEIAAEPAATSNDVQTMHLDPAPAGQARELQEMPADYRAEFPKLTLDVHFYDEDVTRRFVMINGKRYHEGDTLQEGPQVNAITDTGVILSHHGQDVLLPAAR